MITTQLKHCPFCNNEPYMTQETREAVSLNTDSIYTVYIIHCPKCNTCMENPNLYRLIDTWNTRA